MGSQTGGVEAAGDGESMRRQGGNEALPHKKGICEPPEEWDIGARPFPPSHQGHIIWGWSPVIPQPLHLVLRKLLRKPAQRSALVPERRLPHSLN